MTSELTLDTLTLLTPEALLAGTDPRQSGGDLVAAPARETDDVGQPERRRQDRRLPCGRHGQRSQHRDKGNAK